MEKKRKIGHEDPEAETQGQGDCEFKESRRQEVWIKIVTFVGTKPKTA